MSNMSDRDWMGQQLLYPLDDPTTAFTNALQDSGVNPYRSNPFVTQLMRAAPGARIAFLGGNSGTAHPALNPSANYGSFLRSQIGGGNLMNTLQQSAGNFGGMLNRVKAFEAAQAGGQNPSQIDPYSAGLRDIFAANNGQGAVSAYAALRTPMMGTLAQPYTRALQNSADAGLRQFGQRGGINDNVWDFLFPGGVF